MKKGYLLLLATLAVACQSKDNSVIPASNDGKVELTFKACYADADETRTALQEDGSIKWNPYETINLFYGNAYSAPFVSTNDEPDREVEFHGSLSDFHYNNTDSFWAVYPYDENNTCDGSSVTVTLPSTQTAVAGSFDDELFISVAKSNGLNLYFYNLCGGVRFTVQGEGIRSVRIAGANGETLAGKVKVTMDKNGLPYVSAVEEAATVIQVNAPGGGTFEPGKPYYIVMLPCTANNGFRMRFTAESKSAVVSISKKLTVKRSVFGILSAPDTDLYFKDEIPSGNISFMDQNLKAKLVAVFDTNADGELSYAEADAVTSLSGVFGTTKSYTSFDEFQYFTSVRTIENGLFRDWSNLVSITLPESVNTIGRDAFRNCIRLKSVHIGNLVRTIGYRAFVNCKALESIIIPDSVKTIESSVSNPSTTSDSETNDNYLYGAFQNCYALKTVVIGDGIETISPATFFRCFRHRRRN